MERIDKVIASQTSYSRKDVKDLIRKKKIVVNDEVILKSDIKIDCNVDVILIDGKKLNVRRYVYLMLNKPKGYISATTDRSMETVLDLVPQEYLCRDLFPAGRLDKDTTGLMLITDDGDFAHEILSPKKHIKKMYNVMIDIPINDEMVIAFKNGINLKDCKCKPAILEITGEYTGRVTLTEGRYHQIKRMFGCFGASVLELERIGMGNFLLPDDLLVGECREFTDYELDLVKEICD